MQAETRLYNLQVAWMDGLLNAHQLKIRLVLLANLNNPMLSMWLDQCNC